jgi:hypothetical protein
MKTAGSVRLCSSGILKFSFILSTPGVSSLGCALVAVKACLLVLLCCVHPTVFLTPYLPYSTVVPSARYTRSTLSCLYVV